MANHASITLEQLFRYYRNLPHQAAAISELEADIKANGFEVAMHRDRPWFSSWSASGKQQDVAKLAPGSPFSSRLTPHVTLGEFALNSEDRRFDHQYQVDTAAELATFLERARQAFGGKPVVITSGYRPAAVNRSVGGASNSEHLYSSKGVGAVDFYIAGANIEHVQEWCDEHWPYSIGYGAQKGFVHVGIRAGRPRVRWDY